MLARLAETRAAKPQRADPEIAADQVVERNARGRDVATALGRSELDTEGGKGLERRAVVLCVNAKNTDRAREMVKAFIARQLKA